MDLAPPKRIVTLVLVAPTGKVIGSMAPFEVGTPWWQEAEPVVQAAREKHGIEVTILRILSTERAKPHGGAVTYVAEAGSPLPAQAWHERLDDHALRMPWARPGGPDRDLAWAEGELEARGIVRIGPPQQVRTWNLSSIWRLPLEGETAWLKVVPPFFAHEGPMLERLESVLAPTPRLIVHAGPRMLIHEIAGEDLYHASLSQQRQMITLLVGLQRSWIGRARELLVLGLPDWRAPSLGEAITSLVERTADELSPDDRSVLGSFVARLELRLAAAAECGLPDTLVHGDFHPGNFRGEDANLTLLDWGDCGVGNPLLDEPAFMERVTPRDLETIRQHWHRAWQEAVPGSDPDRAVQLLTPIAAARQAVIYGKFLDNIEPSERVYHRSDLVNWLRRCASLLRKEAA